MFDFTEEDYKITFESSTTNTVQLTANNEPWLIINHDDSVEHFDEINMRLQASGRADIYARIGTAVADKLRASYEAEIEELYAKIAELEQNNEHVRKLRKNDRKERNEFESKMLTANKLLTWATETAVARRGFIPSFVQDYNEKLKTELELYYDSTPSEIHQKNLDEYGAIVLQRFHESIVKHYRTIEQNSSTNPMFKRGWSECLHSTNGCLEDAINFLENKDGLL